MNDSKPWGVLRVVTLPIMVPLLFALPVAAALPDRLAPVYSSLHISPETGDTGGMQIILLASERETHAVLQCAGSVLDRPVLVQVTKNEAAGTLAFAAHQDADNECPMEAFTAAFGKNGLRVHYPGGYDPGLLKPRRSIEP